MFYEGKNVLVTGGTGFVGINLINKLLDLKANVFATLYKTPIVLTDKRIKYIPADLTRAEDCKRVCINKDYVFMCAANTSGAAIMEKTPLVHVTPNVLMNTLMLEAAYEAKVKKFLFISSNTVYPLSDYPLKEEDCNGELFNKYFCVGWMKRFSEIMCEMYSSKIKNPMTTIIIRPGNLMGPFDDFNWETSHSTAALVRRVVEKHDPIEVWGNGSDIKDLLYISDFIEGLILAMEKIEKFDIINLASGKSYSIKDTLNILLDIENYNPKIKFDISKPVMIPKRLISIEKAKKVLGFKPSTKLETGLRRTVEWYKRNAF